MRGAVGAVAAAVASFLLACGGTLSSAEGDFKAGRYAEAKEKLVELEPSYAKWKDAQRGAEYCLYRGLTHAALGDRAAAALWLGRAKEITDAVPAALSQDDTARLKLGLSSVGPDVAPPP
ncbi:MAG: hypothetical protein JNL38_05420 [Myxococcales bacterium]|nr:hypothetical protein [Myxococcales bacterium]